MRVGAGVLVIALLSGGVPLGINLLSSPSDEERIKLRTQTLITAEQAANYDLICKDVLEPETAETFAIGEPSCGRYLRRAENHSEEYEGVRVGK